MGRVPSNRSFARLFAHRAVVVLLGVAMVLIGALVVVAASGGSAASGASTAGAVAAPPPPPARDFRARVTNPWLPLRPGTTWRYRGVKDRKAAVDVVTVTSRVTRIAGRPCVTIRDRLFLAGRLAERTTDWYTQDRAGNVWYFGEATAELDRNGKVVSTEGSWRAGAAGARPGIFMPAHPRVGQAFQQELFRGHAEDTFRIASLHATVTVPFGTFHDGLLTRETTALEPGVVDHKVYVRGIGDVSERTARGPREVLDLVSVTPRPPTTAY